jgi:hypothetical protein
MGGARGDLGEDLLHLFSLPLLHLSTALDPQPVLSITTTPSPTPACRDNPAPTSPRSLSLAGVTREHGRRPEASGGSHRPTLRHQTPLPTSRLDQSSPAAQSTHRPRCGPVLLTLYAAQTRHDRHARSRAHTHALVTLRTRACTASKPQQRATLA